ncbi:hypothetical protein BGX27_000791 [Mortierella sp. AM989]|nr:hypothetical protein BGX27_000791 [Mortierella sp. AM989]
MPNGKPNPSAKDYPLVSGIEKLQEKVAALTLELRNAQLDHMDANDYLESTQANLDVVLSNLDEKDLELKNSELALANCEYARQMTKAELDKELSSHAETKLEPKNIKGALVNSERARQEANRDRVMPCPHKEQEVFVVIKKLRFDPSPRGENVIQHMKRDKDAPIKLTNRSFVLRGNNDTEPEMIEYITKVFNTYTDDCSEAAVVPKSE